MSFPKNFKWGVATSAGQIEGGRGDSGKGLDIWDVFSLIPGMVADGSNFDVTCDHYNRYPEDVKHMVDLDVDSYRFSFSWSRIFPYGIGAVNQKGVDFYKRLLDELHKANIEPNATLYHWDLPYELERMGGWCNRDSADWFAQYADFMFRTFGSEIPLWTTLNEPIATYVGYAHGGFAPGRKVERYGREAVHNMLRGHGKAVDAFRASTKGAEIGVVVDIWHRHPKDPGNPADVQLAIDENETNYKAYLNPIFNGRYSDHFIEIMEAQNSMPDVRAGDMEQICRPLDFYGLNCYNRVVVSADGDNTINTEQAGGNFLDNGTEYYPKAVYDAIKIIRAEFDPKIPIYVTENGTYNCGEAMIDGEIHDADRIRYVEGFLSWIEKAIEEGEDIRGYYLWSLMDNMEWCAGRTLKYGIIHTDFETGKRTWKDSAHWYRDFIKKQRGM